MDRYFRDQAKAVANWFSGAATSCLYSAGHSSMEVALYVLVRAAGASPVSNRTRPARLVLPSLSATQFGGGSASGVSNTT